MARQPQVSATQALVNRLTEHEDRVHQGFIDALVEKNAALLPNQKMSRFGFLSGGKRYMHSASPVMPCLPMLHDDVYPEWLPIQKLIKKLENDKRQLVQYIGYVLGKHKNQPYILINVFPDVMQEYLPLGGYSRTMSSGDQLMQLQDHNLLRVYNRMNQMIEFYHGGRFMF